MAHLPSQLVDVLDAHGPASRSRRGLLLSGLGLGFALATGGVVRPPSAQAAMDVQVAAPRITRTNDCQATVSVDITLVDAPSERRYLLYGDILEAETGTEEADFCCTLHARHALVSPGMTRDVTLTQQAMAVDLGLVRGMGPAANEAFSPDLVELFARIWLRDLATEEVLGPWDSPQRIAVSRALPGLMPSENLLGNPLMTPRGPAPAITSASDSWALPLLPCAQ
jgi:hypothetical protein